MHVLEILLLLTTCLSDSHPVLCTVSPCVVCGRYASCLRLRNCCCCCCSHRATGSVVTMVTASMQVMLLVLVMEIATAMATTAVGGGWSCSVRL